jgi:hypothetical protein
MTTGGAGGSKLGAAEVGRGFGVLVGKGLEVLVAAGGCVGGTGVFVFTSAATPPLGLLCGRVVAVGVAGSVCRSWWVADAPVWETSIAFWMSVFV